MKKCFSKPVHIFLVLLLLSGVYLYPVAAEPFSVRKLPDTVVDGASELTLSYMVAVKGKVAGVAQVKGDLVNLPRVFKFDLATQKITLGPSLPKLSEIYAPSIDSMAISLDGNILVSYVVPDDSGLKRRLNLLSTSNFRSWKRIALPIRNYDYFQVFGVDQSGLTYLQQTFKNKNKRTKQTGFSVSPTGKIRKLDVLSSYIASGVVSPSGMIATYGDTSVHLVDSRKDATIGTARIPEVLSSNNPQLAGVSDKKLIGLTRTLGKATSFNFRSGAVGQELQNFSSSKFVPMSSGFFASLQHSGPYGTSVVLFDSERALIPSCAYHRGDPRAKAFTGLPTTTAGSSIVVTSGPIGDLYESREKSSFLLTPNFNELAPNYCSQIEISAVGECAELFTKQLNMLRKINNAALPAQCTFNVILKNPSGDGLDGSLKVTLDHGGEFTSSDYSLTSVGLNVTLPTGNIFRVYFTASPLPDSPY